MLVQKRNSHLLLLSKWQSEKSSLSASGLLTVRSARPQDLRQLHSVLRLTTVNRSSGIQQAKEGVGNAETEHQNLEAAWSVEMAGRKLWRLFGILHMVVHNHKPEKRPRLVA